MPGRRRATAYQRPGLSIWVQVSADAVLLTLVRRSRSSPTADLRIASRTDGLAKITDCRLIVARQARPAEA
jgi:hypothetical protein